MKILITSIVDLQSSQHNRPHQLVKYLSKKHDVTFLSINDWWKAGQGDLKSYSSDFEEIFKKVNILHLTEEKVSPIIQELLSSKRVKDIAKEGFDVHLNYNTLISGYAAARGINTVYDIADDLGAMIRSSPQIPRLLRPFGGALGDYLINRNINISKKVTVTTDTLIDSYNIPMNKSKVIPNGVDTELFRNCGNVKREELDPDCFIIGYVGVLREWVDLEPVMSALKGLDASVKLIIIGKEGKFNENKALVKKYGVADRVQFVGMIPYSQVPQYISSMDVCIIPFKRNAISNNALPLKLFEYMACEKPVISTEIRGVKKIARDRVLYANSSKDYISQIRNLLDNRELRLKLGKNGRKFVQENYDWSAICMKMEKILYEAGRINNE